MGSSDGSDDGQDLNDFIDDSEINMESCSINRALADENKNNREHSKSFYFTVRGRLGEKFESDLHRDQAKRPYRLPFLNQNRF